MNRLSSRAVVRLAVALALLAALPLGAQQPAGQKPPEATFKVRVEYVEVDAVVHDKQGRFIADLSRDDFEVYEDGKRQQVDRLELVNLPVEQSPLAPKPAVPARDPDVVSNAQPPGRVYLIVIDDLHVEARRTVLARQIARRFIERNLAPGDVAAVALTSGTRRGAQEFTGNRRLLFEAVDRVVGRKLQSPGLVEVGGGAAPGDVASNPNLYGRERVFNARSSLETLMSLATFAGTIRNRRKAIVLIGEGIDYRFTEQGMNTADRGAVTRDQASWARELRDDLKLFVDTANRANVTLYALDPRVYTQGGDDLVEVASAQSRLEDAQGNQLSVLGPLLDDLRASQDNLRTLATETGGFAVTGSPKALDDAYERIRDENGRYYLLAYYPTSDKTDGKFRRIEVRVTRPGAVVTARKGYVAAKTEKAARPAAAAAKDDTSAPLRDALAAALPTPGLPISVSAVSFRAANGAGSVLVMLQTPPDAVLFTQKDGKVYGELEVGVLAVDYENKPRGGVHLDLTMPLKPETADGVRRLGLLVQARVTLPPGRYVLRVGARDAVADRVGAVHCDLEVPDYAKTPLNMSGLVLSSESTTLANPRPDKDIPGAMPGSPVVIRDVRQGDRLGVLAEIYDSKLATPHDVDIVTTVVGEDGREAYRHDDQRSTGEMQAASGGFGYLLAIPLNDVAPGSYLLRVEARSRLDPDHPVAREAVFVVK